MEGGPLAEADKEWIEAIRKEFEHQFCRRCDYCQPCTEQIAIQFVLGVKSFIKRFGAQLQQARSVKNNMEKARHCSECGECLRRCPYGLPIPDLIKENLSLYDAFMSGLEPLISGRSVQCPRSSMEWIDRPLGCRRGRRRCFSALRALTAPVAGHTFTGRSAGEVCEAAGGRTRTA